MSSFTFQEINLSGVEAVERSYLFSLGGKSSENGNSYRGRRFHLSVAYASRKSLLSRAIDALRKTFLPADYPHSVRPEYLQYQVLDSIQGLCSYLRAVLTAKSVLQGVGVGSAEASALEAAFIWMMRDGAGETNLKT